MVDLHGAYDLVVGFKDTKATLNKIRKMTQNAIYRWDEAKPHVGNIGGRVRRGLNVRVQSTK
jgi:hypothetical protein